MEAIIYMQSKTGAEAVRLTDRGIITAGSFREGYPPELATDGHAGTAWLAAPYYQWWKSDLGGSFAISRIRVEPPRKAGAYYRYHVEYSIDDLNWQLLAEKSDEKACPDGGDWYSTEITARYLRITMTYCSVGDTVGLSAFEAYGNPGGGEASSVRIASQRIPAVTADEVSGFARESVENIEAGQVHSVFRSGEAGSYLLLRGVDFGEGADQMRASFGFLDKDRTRKVNFELRLDSIEATSIADLTVFRQYVDWSELAANLRTPVCGLHDVYLVVTGTTPDAAVLLHWLSFVRKSPLPQPEPCPAPLPEAREYQVYFGNLHSHTALSDGIGTPDEAFDYARYEAGLDFLAVTEHSNLYDNYFDWDKSRKWADIKRSAAEKTEDGAFVALIGSETTWYNQFGHMNTYEIDFFLNTCELNYNDIPTYYHVLKQYPASINQWNHPWSCGDRHLDGFDPYDPDLDKVMYLMEINPDENPEMDGLSYYISALDKGWHLSPVGSQDNHHGQWGNQNGLRTGILAEKLTKEHIYDAIRNYRAYFTSSPGLRVQMRVNGKIMGSFIEPVDELSFLITAESEGSEIVRGEIIGGGGCVRHVFENKGRRMNYSVSLPCEGRYFFLKVYQADGGMAATSPVWIIGR